MAGDGCFPHTEVYAFNRCPSPPCRDDEAWGSARQAESYAAHSMWEPELVASVVLPLRDAQCENPVVPLQSFRGRSKTSLLRGDRQPRDILTRAGQLSVKWPGLLQDDVLQFDGHRVWLRQATVALLRAE